MAQIYKSVSHWVDRTNQNTSYYNSEVKSVRKQLRMFFHFLETYALVNGHVLWKSSPNLVANLTKHDKTAAEFRFQVGFKTTLNYVHHSVQ